MTLPTDKSSLPNTLDALWYEAEKYGIVWLSTIGGQSLLHPDELRPRQYFAVITFETISTVEFEVKSELCPTPVEAMREVIQRAHDVLKNIKR